MRLFFQIKKPPAAQESKGLLETLCPAQTGLLLETIERAISAGCIHTLYLKIYFNHILKCKKSTKKYPRIDFKLFYVFTNSFHEKSICLATCIENTKFDAKIRLVTRHFFLFYTDHKKYMFSILGTHTMWRRINEILLNFFDISMIFTYPKVGHVVNSIWWRLLINTSTAHRNGGV